ncbi:branched-chain amino acid ABC transporter substrate-binding protein [Kineosporia sp. J2-2]|uniref:Branched-chain amino acid ABC transporter substrate-binding protein n=1 Tax=Kineosporia corallincola TaxID=2835133 RepID=A0ABS5TCS7_9ACTN|nr:branched-chain amino acid ABC transporter substrate-binding protein [Kineosporia corallincola]MBT0768882.1 branched-chain amino acid ABC transporter substrate-binding protein [Kineosporia corallincola]
MISTDLPLQGASADASTDTNNLIELYLDSIDHKAGDYTVELKKYDNSTAAAGQWDEATCAANAQEHVATANEVAVMGEFNSGCTKLQVPVLNQDPDGPMLQVSHASTNPGLTKAWEQGEPEKYAPSGVKSFARVVTTDDYQGTAAADFAKEDLKVTKCYILNDNQTYGQGIGKAFQAQAEKIGIQILGNEAYDPKQPNYTAVFNKIKSLSPDCIYFAGIYDNNGGQLLKDKVAVLGDNEKVKTLSPDGWTGYPDLDEQKEAEGLYATFAGLASEQLAEQEGAAADLLKSFEEKYGMQPRTSYALYGVAGVQVILEAIEKSDGTKKGVRDAVFEGDGITIPAEESATGKEIHIDPASGDTTAKDISVLQEQDGAQKFLKAQPVE